MTESYVSDHVLGNPDSVFLCHAYEDKERVRQLYNWLTRDGVRCWFDEENLLPGQYWDYEIRRAMRTCRYVVVCLSKAAISKTGYVQDELKGALQLAKLQPEGQTFLIPLKLEECDAPRSLAELHWVALYEEGGYSKLLKALRSRDVSNNHVQSTGMLHRSVSVVHGDDHRATAILVKSVLQSHLPSAWTVPIHGLPDLEQYDYERRTSQILQTSALVVITNLMALEGHIWPGLPARNLRLRSLVIDKVSSGGMHIVLGLINEEMHHIEGSRIRPLLPPDDQIVCIPTGLERRLLDSMVSIAEKIMAALQL